MARPKVDRVEWITKIPDAPKFDRWQIERVKGSKENQYVILSDGPLAAFTHYCGGTVPCAGSTCKLCSEAVPKRMYGWLACTNFSHEAKYLVEMPHAAYDTVYRAYRQLRTLRGHTLKIKRVNDKRNGAVICAVSMSKILGEELPPSPNVAQLLERIWGVNRRNAATAVEPLQIADLPTGTEG